MLRTTLVLYAVLENQEATVTCLLTALGQWGVTLRKFYDTVGGGSSTFKTDNI